MSIHVPENFYRQTITRAVTLTTGVNIYVSAHPTPAEGYIAISPASATLREIVYYTAKGTDGNGTYITITTANRGLGGTTAQTHAIGESVRMNVSAETIQEISDALDQIVAGGAQDASVSVKGIAKLSVAPASASNPIAVGTNDPRVLTNPAEKKFGGTGADGALAITSGATNIDLAGAQVVTKNYTSISITGTGSLTFTNPNTNGTVIVLKSQGNVTLTSSAAPMIDARNCGANGGAHTQTNLGTGDTGTTGFGFTYFITNGGVGQTSASTPSPGAAGSSTLAFSITNTIKDIYRAKDSLVCCGAGGGGGSRYISGGSGDDIVGGDGGRGGGVLFIECGGAWNFTTTGGISVSGSAGQTGTGTTPGSSSFAIATGGGGGGAGCFRAWYNTLTANTGTVTAGAGAGGAGVRVGTSPGVNGTPGGEGYGLGYSSVAQNTEFA